MKMTLKAFIQHHPVAAYFGLAFLIAWAGCTIAVGPKFMRGEIMQFTDTLTIFLAMLVGPSLAGIILTGMVGGREALRDLFSRMLRWRVRASWYAALLIFPMLILAVLWFLSTYVSPDFAPNFLPVGILVGLFAGFFEETGWMGFAFPRIHVKYSALTSGILLGLLHVTWHLVPDYLGAYAIRGEYWFPHFLAMMLLAMTAMRILIVWVYINTRSLFLSQLMHASSTGFLFVFDPTSIPPAMNTLWYMVYGVVLWAVVIGIIAFYGKHLVRQIRVQADLLSTPAGNS